MGQSTSEVERLKEERTKIFKDMMRGENKTRILTDANVQQWTLCDAGFDYKESLYNYDLRIEAQRQFQERYNFDMYNVTLTNYPLRVQDPLGGNPQYNFDFEKFSASTKRDMCVMQLDEYDEVKNDFQGFFWKKWMPRYFPMLAELSKEEQLKRFKESYPRYQEYNKFCQDISDMLTYEYGVISRFVNCINIPDNPYDTLFQTYRGIRNTSLDWRRHQDKVMDFVNSQIPDEYTPEILGDITANAMAVADVENAEKKTTFHAWDYCFSTLAPTMLSAKQFEKIYWPQLKKIYDFAVKYDKVICLLLEGSNEHLFEFYQEAPKGHFVIFTEDDIYVQKEKLGKNMVIDAGIPSAWLNPGTPVDRAVAMTQKVLDDVAGDGNIIFTWDKALNYPNDASRENLLAVKKTVDNFRL